MKHEIVSYRVKNWERFQHYKDRNPPWIKLHYEIMTSSDWVVLSDASKLLAVVCMLVASRNNGDVPGNPEYFKRVAYLDKLPDFKPLLECGFLENPLAKASNSKRKIRNAIPETYRTETEKEREKEEANASSKEVDRFLDFWLVFPKQRAGSKTNAAKAYAAARKRGATDDELIDAVTLYANSDEVRRGFAKGATAWLNDDRWTVDYKNKPKEKSDARTDTKGASVRTKTERMEAAKLRAAINGGYATDEEQAVWNASAQHGRTAEERSAWAVTAGRNADAVLSRPEAVRQGTGDARILDLDAPAGPAAIQHQPDPLGYF